MEAARVAALRGHQVALYERDKALGGQLKWASKPPFRGEYEQVVRYLSRQIEKAGVQINLEQEVDKEMIYNLEPDVVVVATGSRPFASFIPGREKNHVVTYLDILGGNVVPGRRVAVIGGQKIGCEIADYLTEKGSEVILTDPSGEFCQDAGMKTRWLLMERLENLPKLELRLKTTVENIDDTAIVIQNEGRIETIDPIDQVVLAMGKISRKELGDALTADSRIKEIYTVGDCILPRKMTEAIYEGSAVGHRI